MTTDAAVAEVQEQQTGQQPASDASAEVEQPVVPNESSAEGAVSAEAAGQSESGAPEGEPSSAEDSYDLDALLQEVGFESTPDDDKPLPGKTHAQIEEEQRQAAWQNLTTFRNSTLQAREREWGEYADRIGLDPADKTQGWQWIRQIVTELDGAHTNAKLQPYNALAKLDIIKEQDPEAHAIFSEREYDSVVNTMAGLMASGRKAELARLKKQGIPTTKADLKKVTDLAFSKGQGKGERNADSANSGRNNGVNGAGLPAGLPTLAQLRAASPEQYAALKEQHGAALDRVWATAQQ